MSATSDERVRHQDGSEHQIRRRQASGQRGEQSFIIRVVGPDGLTREIWHEVLDHLGQVIHRHATFHRPSDGA